MKIIIHFSLLIIIIVAVGFLISLLKDIREGLLEGIEEGRQEVEEENRELEKLKSKIYKTPVVEQMAIALSCPFRISILCTTLTAFSPAFFQIGNLTEEEETTLAMALTRDFEISNQYDAVAILCEMKAEINGFEGKVLMGVMELYVITSCAELQYIDFSDYEERILLLIQSIRTCVNSWEDFARVFIEEEKQCGPNGRFGKSLIKYWIKRLLKSGESPWNYLDWNCDLV